MKKDLYKSSSKEDNSYTHAYTKSALSLDEQDKSKKYMPWREDPVQFKEFVESAYFCNHPSLSDNMYHEAERLLGKDPTKIFTFDRVAQELLMLAGKGSGKSLMGILMEIYLMYCTCCLREPLGFFNLSTTDYVDFINVARSWEQGITTYFSRLRNKFKETLWFKEYFDFVEGGKILSVATKKKLGEISILTDRVEISPQHLRAINYHSQVEKFEGSSVLFFFMDEVSGHISEKEQRQADKTYKSLRSSTRELPYVAMLASYPRLDECLWEGMEIKDVKTKEQHTVGEWAEMNKNFFIKTKRQDGKGDTIVKADVPFYKGIDDVYEVEMETGEKIIVGKGHRFLSKNGWQQLLQLKEGDEIDIKLQYKKHFTSCLWCNKQIRDYPSSPRKFCCKEHEGLWRKGKKLSIEHNKKKSLALKGRTLEDIYGEEYAQKRREFLKNNNPVFRKEIRDKISESHKQWHKDHPYPKIKRQCPICGKIDEVLPCRNSIFCSTKCSGIAKSISILKESNPNWKGGISTEPYPFEFNYILKEQIKERDHYACRLCGIQEKEHKERYKRGLIIHHINFDKSNCIPSNLTTLCSVCHGRAQSKKDFWIALMNKEIDF